MLDHPLGQPQKAHLVGPWLCPTGCEEMAQSAHHFSENQFQEACAELQQWGPGGANWELLVEILGFRVYRRQDQALGINNEQEDAPLSQ
ncbi:phosphatidylcholine transfer protein-like [Suricata suricatta]|uniref:phosphatidylcholine transfer protein-like n=1 Tax=Suricata suricatta TaxID=37032 RepID=UPI001155EC17|nr:phosphatidylcholine transfer protein-like [Suricata suricatta]